MIVIIDYGLGNLKSVQNAFESIGLKNEITNNVNKIRKADALVLPGVGAANKGMENLKKQRLDELILQQVKKGKPFLGICLGMQLLFEKSEEGKTKCLGLLRGKVKKFKNKRKVPQIGWNQVKLKVKSEKLKVREIFKDISDNSYFYFVNSFYCEPEDKSIIASETDYGEKFPSIILQNNIMATQFHPEKSGKCGFQILKNWKEVYVS